MSDEELNRRFKELEGKIEESSGGLGCMFVVMVALFVLFITFHKEIHERFFDKPHQPAGTAK